MSIKQQALISAIDRLKAIGAQFAIVTVDGAQYGELKIAPALLPKKAKKERPAHKEIYQAPLSKMKVGDVVTLEATEGINAQNLRCSAQAFLIQRHGCGSSTSTVRGNKVEILRLK